MVDSSPQSHQSASKDAEASSSPSADAASAGSSEAVRAARMVADAIAGSIEAPEAEAGLSCPASRNRDAEKVQLAVFDFDGTSISGNSPVMLVSHLARRRLLKPHTVFLILLWAFAYKCRLPQNQSWVRGLVFSAFEGWPVEKVNAFLAEFYDERVAERFRAEADAAMREHAEAGEVVVVVSATFEPILVRAKEQHPFDYQVSTRMRVLDDGTYSSQVDGKCVEGDQKLVALRAFADERFGKGKWEIACAYGDHHSDRAILAAARTPCVVDPDRPLRRTARRQGWTILHW
ncbi:HAD family hydrolase [Xiamenia xianingshaonis]|nr:HAD-IB family hydrolase [Xiamenia xianingshaonis]